MLVEFKPNGEVVTTRHESGGTMTVDCLQFNAILQRVG
jgi:hypothetical protein